MGGRLDDAEPGVLPCPSESDVDEVTDSLSDHVLVSAPREMGQTDPTQGVWEVPVYFALVTPKPGAHTELLTVLQRKIVAPLAQKGILSEFRVLTCTPPSFVAETSTLLVFELVVPCSWPITDWDVQQWQGRLGSKVRLVVAPSQAPRRADSWDTRRARSVMTRAMVLPPTKKVPATKPFSTSWIAACVERGDSRGERSAVSSSVEARPTLSVIEENSGRRVQLTEGGATLMTEAIAWELCQHLPVSIQWRKSWRLVYSPRVHGLSLKTFYRRLENEQGPNLLLIQDHRGNVFGGFASVPWHSSDRYYGNGESFVFKFGRRLPKPVVPLMQQIKLLASGEEKKPKSAADAREEAAANTIRQAIKVLSEWHPRVRAEAERAEAAAVAAGCVRSPTEALDAVLGAQPGSAAQSCISTSSSSPNRPLIQHDADLRDGPPDEIPEDEGDLGLEVFNWSLKDPFFMFSDMDCVAFGGGSAFALYLEKDLLHGMSEPCSTFGSQMLSSTEHFIIADMECWVFDDPSMLETQAEMAGRPPR